MKIFSHCKKLFIPLVVFFACPGWSFGQLQASFNINYQTPNCAPEIVSFQNTSTGTGLTYQWNFGIVPGVNSVLINPATTYLSCGSYPVTLTVTNSLGQTSTVTNMVTVNCSPTANFSVSTNSGCSPLSVQFTNLSVSGSGTLLSYQWDFGDGSTGYGPNPLHVYTGSGCKTVTLIVINSNGCSGDTTILNLICVLPSPASGFTSNPNPAVACASPFPVIFSANNIVTSNTYQWNFNGGNPANTIGTIANSTFNTPGYHAVTLTVTDSIGCVSSTTLNQSVLVGNYNSSFSISNLSSCSPATFSPHANGNGVISWLWTAPGATIPSSTNQNPVFSYTVPGTYQICLQTTFNGGCVASNCTTIVVNQGVVANFSSPSNLTGCQIPAVINFQNNSTGATMFNWHFPGGHPSSSNNMIPPAIIYDSCTHYNVWLEASNGSGCYDSTGFSNFIVMNCPHANFTCNKVGGCLPLTVNFSSMGSTGNPVQWEWNFGTTGNPNLVQSNLPNPSFTFNQLGCFDIRLVITNAQGCTDTFFQPALICTGSLPQASFTANPTQTCAYSTIAFTNTSAATSPNTTFYWDFENLPFQAQSTLQNPFHNYSDTGWFSVTLVTCNSGCCDTTTYDSFIHIFPPVAAFDNSFDCALPYDYHFDATASIGANIFSWNFPGGNPATSSNPIQNVHWNTSGNYNVRLIVTNQATGCMDTSFKLLKIRNVIAGFTCPQTGCAPMSLHLTNTSVDASSHKWFIYNSAGTVIFTSANANPTAILTIPGTYSILYIAKAANGCSDTLYQQDYVTLYGLAVNVTNQSFNNCGPSLVQFNQTSTSPNSVAVSYNWNFGDPASGPSNTSTLTAPAHIYAQDGNYHISVNILDNHGCTSLGTLTNPIIVHQPVADFSALDSTLCLNNQTCFFDNSPGSNLSYNWNLGNGNTSQQANPCLVYNAIGNYTVSLTITDGFGCVGTLVKPNYISVTDVSAFFIADSTISSCPPLSVHFANLSSGIDPGTIYHWSFGDGSYSTLATPNHIYSFSGIFTVTLIVTNSNGCMDTLQMDSLIHIAGPIATITSSTSGTCIPINACFVASSNSINYTWNFGNGVVVPNGPASICFSYINFGTFYPNVILSDGLGCTYAYPIPPVFLGIPVATFSFTPNNFCESGIVSFLDSASSGLPIINYSWNFGDPGSSTNISTAHDPSHTYAAPGNYPVVFSVTNSNGCTNNAYDTVAVLPAPVASFSTNGNLFCEGNLIAFHNTSQPSVNISSFQWNFGDPANPANNTSSLSNPSHQYLNPGTYSITLIIVSLSGCSDTIVQQINIHSLPLVSAGLDVTVCLNSSVILNGSGGINYSWSPATGLNNAFISNPSASPLANTIYQMIAIDAFGCKDTDQVSVTVRPIPNIIANGGDTICLGSSIQLSASGGVSYSWSPASTLTGSNTANPIATPNATNIYTVTGFDSLGCANTDFTLVYIPTGQSLAGPDTYVCIGDSIQLQGTGGVTYVWSPAAGLSDPTIANPFCNILSTSVYTLNLTDVFGCALSDMITVTVRSLPLIDAGPDVNECEGRGEMLTGSGGVIYNWSPATWLNSTSVATPVTTALNDIVYHLNAWDSYGCKNSDSVFVHVIKPFISSVSMDTSICFGSSVQMEANGSISYKWIPSIWLNNPDIPNPVATPQSSMLYQVVISDNVCFTDTASVNIMINPLPMIEAGADQTILAGNHAALTAESSGNYFSWSPSGTLSCTDCKETVASPEITTLYYVSTTDLNGCRNYDSVRVEVLCKDAVVYLPNAFTPNEDLKNDKFFIRSLGLKEVRSFRIYDRWGAMIFETNDLNTGWDGTYKGVPLNAGVFVYSVDAICSTGDVVSLQGNITLIR